MDLKGMVALVTGGNGGLGQRICHALAQEGANVAVMYARSRDQAESVASELTSRYQINAQAFACDITDDAAVDRLVGEVRQAFGRLLRTARSMKWGRIPGNACARVDVQQSPKRRLVTVTFRRSKYRPRASTHSHLFPKPQHTCRSPPLDLGPWSSS